MDNPLDPPEEPDAEKRRTWDPELKCMAAMLRQLDELDEKARPRVVQWLRDRFEDSKP